MSQDSNLQPLHFPLYGSRLIEASAGTGKTYTIAALYVRLVLGHGEEMAFGRTLTPPEILVVTFTDAATKELRDRIRRRLIEAAQHFQAEPTVTSEDKFLQDLRAEYSHDQWPGCVRKLQLAAEWMDEAAISTIHSWCNRMLREHAFESGSLFSQSLATNSDELKEEVVRDYWRTFIAPLEEGDVRELISWTFPGKGNKKYSITDPSNLHEAIKNLIGLSQSLEPAAEPEEAFARRKVERVHGLRELKRPWSAWIEELRGLFDDLRESGKVNKSKLQQRHYNDWLQKLVEWRDSFEAEIPNLTDTAWNRLTSKGLEEIWLSEEEIPQHPAFSAIETLRTNIKKLPSARNDLLSHAARWFADRFDLEQNRRAQMGHDDLLIRLRDALGGPNAKRLAEQIRHSYPVALIDEFQDTDPVQYRIFDAIYDIASNDNNSAIILIGDPKQAIYAFRGADIYTYLDARKACDGRLYTLSRNFRSTQSMVEATNRCFEFAESREQGKGAFLFRENGGNPVPFVLASANGRHETFLINNSESSALTAWWLESEENKDSVSVTDYRERMGETCASEMVRLLNLAQQGQAGFASSEGLRELRPADMAVLVNGKNEASIIRAALARRGVRSVYLSERGSVYKSAQASEILHWLGACAEPDDPSLLKAALATPSLGLDWLELNRINNDELAWEERVLQFRGYRDIWRSRGLLPMLRLLLNDFAVPARLLSASWRGENDTITGERVLTNILHLAELLQEASELLEGEHALIRHLLEQIRDAENGDHDDSRQIRLESDSGLVKVVTVHKSKGLEYPLVFFPFASSYRSIKADDIPLRWHDEEGRLRVSLDSEGYILERADEERLGEDLRKLYVALTRAQYATWIGLGSIAGEGAAKNAMGYLLGCEAGNAAGDQLELLEALCEGQDQRILRVLNAPAPANEFFQVKEGESVKGQARQAVRDLRQDWWIASYSSISAHHGHSAADSPTEEHIREQPVAVTDITEDSIKPLGVHAFPRGADAGSFLHSLLEWAAQEGFGNTLTNPNRLRDTIARRCVLRGWEAWIDPLTDWVKNVLEMPVVLPGKGGTVSLGGLSTYQAEMEFWFSVHDAQTEDLDRLVQEFTLDGEARPPLTPTMLNGMLKGFIDLVFEYEGRYYVADYKSNWLGIDDSAYSLAAMRTAILSSRYELQYVIYLFALHRLLKARLPDYDFDRHIGGAAYLFLRGTEAPSHGVHIELPPKELFERLDALFSYSEERSAA